MAFVQSIADGDPASSKTPTVTLGATPTPGNTLVCCVSWSESNTNQAMSVPPSCSGSGNTFTQIGLDVDVASGMRMAVWQLVVVSGDGATISALNTFGTSTHWTISVVESSSRNTASLVDVIHSNSSGSNVTSEDTGTTTSSFAGDDAIAFFGYQNVADTSNGIDAPNSLPTTGWNLDHDVHSAGVAAAARCSLSVYHQDGLPALGGGVKVAQTITGSGRKYVAMVVTLKVGGGSAPAGGSSTLLESGVVNEGTILHGSTSGWSNSPTVFNHQFLRDGVVFTGITYGGSAAVYTTVHADATHTITYQASATNAAGTSTPATAANSVVVQPTAPVPIYSIVPLAAVAISAPPHYTYVLCKATGEPIAELLDAQTRKLAFLLSGAAACEVVLTLRDPLALQIQPGFSRLKVWRSPTSDQLAVDPTLRRRLVFYGSLPTEATSLDTANDTDGTITCLFQDPRWVLARRYSLGTETFAGIDQGMILWGLVDAQNQRGSGWDTWIRQGGVTTGINRDRTYDQHQVSDLFTQMVGVIDGPDVDLDPFDEWALNGGQAMGLLRAYAHQGVDRPNAVFSLGTSIPSNVKQITQTYEPITTFATYTGTDTVTGAPLSASYGSPVAAPAGVGALEDVIADPDVSIAATLAQKANGRVYSMASLRPVLTIVEPSYDAPRPFEHYELGDTIRAVVRKGVFRASSTVRVHAIQLAPDGEGAEHVTLTTSSS